MVTWSFLSFTENVILKLSYVRNIEIEKELNTVPCCRSQRYAHDHNQLVFLQKRESKTKQ